MPLLAGLCLFDASDSQAIAEKGSNGASILQQFQRCLPTAQHPAGDRDCIEKLEQRLLARPEERKAFYRYVSARLNCERAALGPVVHWFYLLSLEKHWVEEAKGLLLRCLEPGELWYLLPHHFGSAKTSGRLSRTEWRRVKALCASQREDECLRLSGSPGFDAAFRDKAEHVAFIRSVVAAAHPIQRELTLASAGAALCRISAPVSTKDPRGMRLAHALECHRGGPDANLTGLVVSVLRDFSLLDGDELGSTFRALERYSWLRKNASVRKAVAAICRKDWGPRATRTHLCLAWRGKVSWPNHSQFRETSE